MKKIISLLTAVLMVSAIFVGCKDDSEAKTTTVAPNNSPLIMPRDIS